MEFGKLVRQERIRQYKNAREFYEKNPISCTYPYYSRIEGGILPDVKIAIEILNYLKINLRKGLTAWIRDQMPTPSTKALFSDPTNEESYSGETNNVQKSLIVNRMQARLLQENPIYWEILMYLVSVNGIREVKVSEIAKVFRLTAIESKNFLDILFDYGLIETKKGETYKTKEWIIIPFEQEFQVLRDINFKRAYEQFCSLEASDNKFRTTITKLLQPEDLKVIEANTIALVNSVISLPNPQNTDNAIPYTVGVFASPRKFGK